MIKLTQLLMDFSAVHAKLFPGAKHNGAGNRARDQKNLIVLNKFFSHYGSKQNFPEYLNISSL